MMMLLLTDDAGTLFFTCLTFSREIRFTELGLFDNFNPLPPPFSLEFSATITSAQDREEDRERERERDGFWVHNLLS